MVSTTEVQHDLHYSARQILSAAVAVATGRLNLDDPVIAEEQVCRGNSPAIEYVRHEIARQVAGLILRTDHNVIAVYEEHQLPEAEEMDTPEPGIADPINLVVYSQLETAALRSLIDAIDQAIAEALAERWGNVSPGVISAEIVDEARSKRLHVRANGFRPPPTLLVSREV
jgi:hypothetical protein